MAAFRVSALAASGRTVIDQSLGGEAMFDQASPEVEGTVVGLKSAPLLLCKIKVGLESGERLLDQGDALTGNSLYLRVSLRLTGPSIQR